MQVVTLTVIVVLALNIYTGLGKHIKINSRPCPKGLVPDNCPKPDLALSTFFPHPEDCHWFFHCSNGIPYCKECPSNLHWNVVLDTCDWPENAGCYGNGSRPTPSPAPVTTTSSSVGSTAQPSPIPCPEGAVPSCPNPDPALSVFFPHEKNCQYFYHCSNGVAYCKVCPAGLHWNEALDTCDWPQHAGCSGNGSSPPSPVPTSAAQSSSESTAPSSISPPIPTTADVTSGHPPTTEIPCPTGKIPTCPKPDPAFSVFFPHEKDCHFFYHCSNGVAYCKICPAGLHWNTALDTCDWPDRAGCLGNGSSTNQPPTQRPTSASVPTQGSTSASSTIQPPTSSSPASSSALSTETTVEVSTNHPSTHLPSSSSSTPTQRPTTDVSQESSPVTDVPCPPGAIPKCPRPDPALSVFFPHENDCHFFYHCSNGVPYCKVCPAGLHWNTKLDTCDWPDRAGCSGNGGNGSSTNEPTTPRQTSASPVSTQGSTNEASTTQSPIPSTPSSSSEPTQGSSSGSTVEPSTYVPSSSSSEHTQAPTTEVSKDPSPVTEVPCPAGVVPNCPVPDPDLSVFFPHEKDCHFFYHCSNGIAYCKVCPPGLHWNSVLDTCDWPDRAGCGIIGSSPVPSPQSTTNQPSSSSSSSSGNSEPVTVVSTSSEDPSRCPNGVIPTCPNPDLVLSKFFPHPNDCHWFYHCSNGRAYCKECPADLHWNVKKDTCDYPERAGCL